jgi:hypothetical protein
MNRYLRYRIHIYSDRRNLRALSCCSVTAGVEMNTAQTTYPYLKQNMKRNQLTSLVNFGRLLRPQYGAPKHLQTYKTRLTTISGILLLRAYFWVSKAVSCSAGQEVPRVNAIGRFVTVLKGTRHWSLSWARLTSPKPQLAFSVVHLNITLVSTTTSTKQFTPSWFTEKTGIYYVIHVPLCTF